MVSAAKDGMTKFRVLLRANRRASTSLKDQQRLNRHDSIVDADEPYLATPASLAQDNAKLTFFDLPPELRNAIYELVASTTVLSLSTARKRPSEQQQEAALSTKRSKAAHKEQPAVIGLLLASRQCRREYLPLVFSTATVVVNVVDFDFRNVIRVAGSLYRTELRALRQNPSLFIYLWTNNCAREHLLILRRWLYNRAEALDRLPWRYQVPLMPTTNVVGQVRQLHELDYYKRKLAELHSKLDENLRWELQSIVQAFDEQSANLGYSLRHLNVQNVTGTRGGLRGLAGGGVV